MTVEDETSQCGREDLVGDPPVAPVRCVKGKGHKGPHVFVHFWREERAPRNPQGE